MMRGLVAVLLAAACSLAAAADKQPHKPPQKKLAAADESTEGFLNLYVEICVRHFGDLEDFRARLLREKVPKLAPEHAKLFLSGMAGDAWPVPYKGKMGNFVLALPAGKNLCLLHAHRANTVAVEKGFLDIVADAPKPMVAKRGPVREELSLDKLKMRTVSSTWAPPGARRKMEFMLTTSASPKAELQALGSVAIVADDGPPKAPARPAPKRTP
ncbi:NMCC_0638 family (lipo)protein [Massilia aerilata]|uniref:Uncharacterized protein n=1 Tax=Massilia aerilata TaxID=453817 RepID=A0ABW0S6J5_9BURK